MEKRNLGVRYANICSPFVLQTSLQTCGWQMRTKVATGVATFGEKQQGPMPKKQNRPSDDGRAGACICGTWVFACGEYTSPCRRLASYRRSAAGMRTKRCDRVATLGENQQGPMTKNKNDSRLGVIFVWQRNLDSNQEQRSQRPVCYPYTIPPLPLRPYILSQRFAFVKCFLKVFCTVLKKAA